MKSQPYVGITGASSLKECKDVCREFYSAGFSMVRSHLPMIGFLVSYNTLNNIPTENKRYPLFENIYPLLREVEGKVFSTIHYNSKEVNTLSSQIEKVFDDIYENHLCRGIQLNIPFPPINEVEKIKQKFPDMKIIFQANHTVLDSGTSIEVTQKIKSYEKIINYVLLDPSGGQGLEFNLEKSIELYKNINKICPNLTIGFAGGLNGTNVSKRITDISQTLGHKDFCIDAEGGLRDKITIEYGDDLLNIEKVRSYLQESKIILKN
jgi:phosphoribosylanthranilate isomerase